MRARRRDGREYVAYAFQVTQSSDIEDEIHHLYQGEDRSADVARSAGKRLYIWPRKSVNRRLSGCVIGFNCGNEAISPFGNGFNEERRGCGIAEYLANLVDGGVEAVVEVDEGVGRPETLMQLLAGDDLPGICQQNTEDLE